MAKEIKFAADRCGGCKFFEVDECWVNIPHMEFNPVTAEIEYFRSVPTKADDLACISFFPKAH